MSIRQGWVQRGRQGARIRGAILWSPPMLDAQGVRCTKGQGISRAAGA
jgi:hypothetical protein